LCSTYDELELSHTWQLCNEPAGYFGQHIPDWKGEEEETFRWLREFKFVIRYNLRKIFTKVSPL
jgi:hypothetical protein